MSTSPRLPRSIRISPNPFLLRSVCGTSVFLHFSLHRTLSIFASSLSPLLTPLTHNFGRRLRVAPASFVGQVPHGIDFLSFGNSNDRYNNNSPWSLSLPAAGVFSPFTPRSLSAAPLLDTPQYIAARDAPVDCGVNAAGSTYSASADTATSVSFALGTPVMCDTVGNRDGGASSGRGDDAPASSVMAGAPAVGSATSAVSSASSGAGHTQRQVPVSRTNRQGPTRLRVCIFSQGGINLKLQLLRVGV